MPTVRSDNPANTPAAEEQTDLVFKALAARPRREILALLATGAGEGDVRCCSPEAVCACAFSEKLGLGAPTISHHMKTLVDAGLVSGEKRGSWVYYKLRMDTVQRVASELLALCGCGTRGCS